MIKTTNQKRNENKNINKKLTKPSQKLTSIKTASIFTETKNTSQFETFYKTNILPCQISHGSINNTLEWKKDFDFDEFDYNPLLIKFF